MKSLCSKVSYSANDTYTINRNLLQVEVFYQEFNYEAVTEMPSYLVSSHVVKFYAM